MLKKVILGVQLCGNLCRKVSVHSPAFIRILKAPVLSQGSAVCVVNRLLAR